MEFGDFVPLSSAARLPVRPPPVWSGWRFAFRIGAALGLVGLFLRRWVPESPRWPIIHHHKDEAEKIVADVERTIDDNHPDKIPPFAGKKARLCERAHPPWSEIWHAVAHEHRKSSILGLSLMVTMRTRGATFVAR